MYKFYLFIAHLLTSASFASDETLDTQDNTVLEVQTCPFSTPKAQWIWQKTQDPNLSPEEKNPFFYLLGFLYFMGNNKENKERAKKYHQVSFALWNDSPLEAWTKTPLDDDFYLEEIEPDQKEAINLWGPLKDSCPWSRHMLAFYANNNGQFNEAKALYRQNPKSFYTLINLSYLLDKEEEILERKETLVKAQDYIEQYALQVHDAKTEKILAKSKKILGIALNQAKDWEKSAQFLKESGDVFKKNDDAEFIDTYESYYDSLKKIFEASPSVPLIKNLQERACILKDLENHGYEKKNDKKNLTSRKFRLADDFSKTGQLEQSAQLYEEVGDLGEPCGYINASYRLTQILRKETNEERQKDILDKAVKMIEAAQNKGFGQENPDHKKALAEEQNSIGLNFDKLGNLKEALKWYEAAAEKDHIAGIYNGALTAITLFQKEDILEQKIQLFEKARSLCEELPKKGYGADDDKEKEILKDLQEKLINNQNTFGVCLFNAGRFQEAWTHFKEGIKKGLLFAHTNGADALLELYALKPEKSEGDLLEIEALLGQGVEREKSCCNKKWRDEQLKRLQEKLDKAFKGLRILKKGDRFDKFKKDLFWNNLFKDALRLARNDQALEFLQHVENGFFLLKEFLKLRLGKEVDLMPWATYQEYLQAYKRDLTGPLFQDWPKNSLLFQEEHEKFLYQQGALNAIENPLDCVNFWENWIKQISPCKGSKVRNLSLLRKIQTELKHVKPLGKKDSFTKEQLDILQKQVDDFYKANPQPTSLKLFTQWTKEVQKNDERAPQTLTLAFEIMQETKEGPWELYEKWVYETFPEAEIFNRFEDLNLQDTNITSSEGIVVDLSGFKKEKFWKNLFGKSLKDGKNSLALECTQILRSEYRLVAEFLKIGRENPEDPIRRMAYAEYEELLQKYLTEYKGPSFENFKQADLSFLYQQGKLNHGNNHLSDAFLFWQKWVDEVPSCQKLEVVQFLLKHYKTEFEKSKNTDFTYLGLTRILFEKSKTIQDEKLQKKFNQFLNLLETKNQNYELIQETQKLRKEKYELDKKIALLEYQNQKNTEEKKDSPKTSSKGDVQFSPQKTEEKNSIAIPLEIFRLELPPSIEKGEKGYIQLNNPESQKYLLDMYQSFMHYGPPKNPLEKKEFLLRSLKYLHLTYKVKKLYGEDFGEDAYEIKSPFKNEDFDRNKAPLKEESRLFIQDRQVIGVGHLNKEAKNINDITLYDNLEFFRKK